MSVFWFRRAAIAGVIAVLVGTCAGVAAADVMQSRGAPVSSAPQNPPLNFTDAERREIAQAVAAKHNDQRSPDGFVPAVGVKVPTKLKLEPLPRPLIYAQPVLQRFDYAQIGNQVLIVDPMRKTVAEIIAM